MWGRIEYVCEPVCRTISNPQSKERFELIVVVVSEVVSEFTGAQNKGGGGVVENPSKPHLK